MPSPKQKSQPKPQPEDNQVAPPQETPQEPASTVADNQPQEAENQELQQEPQSPPDDGGLDVREVIFDEDAETPDPLEDLDQPDVELPSERIPEWRQNRILPTNAAGLTYDKEKDDCFHLNATWKGGCCTIQGNEACPLLGGNQARCEFYVDRKSETQRRQGLPDRERYEMTGKGNV